MTRVLITGHKGFIGGHLQKMLTEDGFDVVGLDLKNGNDICTCKLPDVDIVFHLAAQTDAQNDNAEADAATNIMGSLRVFDRYRHKVVFASSSMVNYPTTPYAISKRACEDYAKLYDVSVVRFPNIYGDGGHSVMDKFREGNIMVVFGDGEQIRTYAPVEAACAALFEYIGNPGVHVLGGRDLTVNQIAAQWPDKKRIDHSKRKNDIADGRQIIG